ncbi:MAG: metallophosphoesterase family protein [Longimicrobiales bacterium]
MPTDSPRRTIRIAAAGDMHFDGAARGALADLFAAASRDAEILVLCGDLTTHGRADQARAFLEEMAGVKIPVVTVLGNHDHEGGEVEEIAALLTDAGVHVLDGDTVVIDGIGFAGVKGFAGGFDRGALAPFGEPLLKRFVQEAIDEALKLENALRALETEIRVAVLHYAPIVGTVIGEPEPIYPFLGSSRLLQPIDTIGADVVFHGHAHHGTHASETPAGIPVFNVSLPLLRADGSELFVWEASAPERRRRSDSGSGSGSGSRRG